MELNELTTGMRYHLSLESLQDEEKMMYRELTERDFIINDPEHETFACDRKEDIIGFTVPLNLT
ncbi:MAG: hypothetical protein ACTSQF_09055 [Candidatus Heimdallarchaeaceae archaeon]